MTEELKGTVTFIDRHKPRLKSGDYRISVSQQLQLQDTDAAATPVNEVWLSNEQKFSVLGDRFSLASELLQARFPPNGNIGEYGRMLPHVALTRATFPYERVISEDVADLNRPWLAVLLLDDKRPNSWGSAQPPRHKNMHTIDKPFFLRRYGDSAAGETLWQALLGAQLLLPIAGSSRICEVTSNLLDGVAYPAEISEEQKEQVRRVAGLTRHGQSLTLSEFLGSHGDPAVHFPAVALESGQHPSDFVSVLDVPLDLLQAYLPPRPDLNWLGHVRHVREPTPEGEVDEHRALVVCGRLPERNGVYHAYLISLEHRFEANGFDPAGANAAADLIRLVSLNNWHFSCISQDHRFEGLLKTLTSGSLRLPRDPAASPQVAERIDGGFVLLPHHMRSGGNSVSYYRGPMIPGGDATTTEDVDLPLPARVSDALLRYDDGSGIFEATYGAAYEIGRLITLENTEIGLAILAWKQTVHQVDAFLAGILENDHLVPGNVNSPPQARSEEEELVIPDAVQNWLDDLVILRNIPFNYLVPDERMLPEESIRFFQVDRFWLEALLDGSLSMGRTTPRDEAQDARMLRDQGLRAEELLIYSGFILRSEAVSGWPDLDVMAASRLLDGCEPFPYGEQLPRKRMDRLSEDVLICIFEGELKTVDIFLKPEGLQFGFKETDTNPVSYFKSWKNPGDGLPDATQATTPIKWRDSVLRLVDMDGFVAAMPAAVKPATGEASAFALQMIEGMPRVRFLFGGDSGGTQRQPYSCDETQGAV